MINYALDNGEDLHREFPETFYLPSRIERETLSTEKLVKLICRISTEKEVHVERMWVCVLSQSENGYIGRLDNNPNCTKEL